MFVRALLALDQDVISLEIPRNDAESRRSMALKDALRARDIADVARAWTHVVRTQRGIAAACLAAVQKYADWVDIALLAADDFVALLFELLNGARAAGPPCICCALRFRLRATRSVHWG